MARRLPPPLTVEEGVRMTAPMSGVKELNDNQVEQLYSKEATATFGTPDIPPRVFTSRDGRDKKVPVSLQEADNTNNNVNRGNVISNTVTTCLNACGGAMYDIWHWPQLPGNTSSRLRTVATRGGRGPYLLFTFVIILFVVFTVIYFIRSRRRQSSVSKYITRTSIGPEIPAIRKPTSNSNLQSALPTPVSRHVVTPPSLAPTTTYHFA